MSNHEIYDKANYDEKIVGVPEVSTQIIASDELGHAEDVIKAENEFTEKEYSKLRWKIDLIIMPVLMLVYGLQYSSVS